MNRLNLLSDLSDAQINDLRQLLQGPLAASWSQHYLEKAFGKFHGAALFHELIALDADGWSRNKISTMLDLLSKDRSNRADRLSWVVTGSVAADLPSRDTGVIFRSLVESAEREILLVSYALFKGKELLTPLHKKMKDSPQFCVRMILDVSRARSDTSISSEIISRFKDEFVRFNWPGEPWPEIYYDPRGLETDLRRKAVIHAKCLITDDNVAFVTSANLTEAAQEKNVEVGVLIKDKEKAQQLKRYFEGLMESRLARVDI